ncbi:MAG: hypothetical protein WAO29_01990 [Candidatus Nanopelagicales bacterium]
MTQRYSITDGVVYPIGRTEATQKLFENTNNVYDIAISGEPFLLASSDRYPYQRQTAQYRKQQFDNSKEIGEQAFEGWWLRSQSSFHLGAGINYLDPLTGENVQYRFKDSAGVDVWTPGQVTMLPKMDEVASITGSAYMVGGIDSLDQDFVFYSDDDELYRLDDTGTAALVPHGGTESILGLVQDGLYYYAADEDKIYRGDLTGTGATGTSYYPTNNAKVVLSYVKQRIVAGIGEKIVEITQSRGGTNPDSSDVRYTHPDTGWTWSAIAEGPTAIYASGYRGNNSSIYKFTLSNVGVMPTLTQAVTAADFPDDEYVMNIATYLGRFIVIGTSKGIRIGILDDNGDITYGPLTYEKTNPVHKVQIAFEDRFAYVTVTNAIDGNSGVIRIDLSQEVEPGRYAYAKDLSTETTGCSCGIAFLGSSGRLVLAMDNEGIFYESITEKVATGFLETGLIRYGTIEKKYFKLVKPRIAQPMDGSIAVSTKTVGGNVNSIITLTNTTPAINEDLGTNLQFPQEALAFLFTFGRSSIDVSKGPEFDGYQIKSLPAVRRNRQLTIPLLNFDFESDRFGVQIGYEGRAFDRLQALESIEALGDTVLVQDFTTGETVLGLIEQLSFERTTPPKSGFSGFGGIIYVSVRTV